MSWYAIEVLATLEICVALESGLTLCILISSSCWTGCKSLLFCQRSQVERTDQWSAAPNPCSFPGKWGIFSHPECNLVSLRCWLKIEKTAYQINCMPMLSCKYIYIHLIRISKLPDEFPHLPIQPMNQTFRDSSFWVVNLGWFLNIRHAWCKEQKHRSYGAGPASICILDAKPPASSAGSPWSRCHPWAQWSKLG